jgi:hypothetical protein
MVMAPQFGRRAHGLGTAIRTAGLTGGPTQFNIFSDFPKPAQTCKFKTDISNALKNATFCMTLDCSVLHNFLNCADFKFQTEIMLNILE